MSKKEQGCKREEEGYEVCEDVLECSSHIAEGILWTSVGNFYKGIFLASNDSVPDDDLVLGPVCTGIFGLDVYE